MKKKSDADKNYFRLNAYAGEYVEEFQKICRKRGILIAFAVQDAIIDWIEKNKRRNN